MADIQKRIEETKDLARRIRFAAGHDGILGVDEGDARAADNAARTISDLSAELVAGRPDGGSTGTDEYVGKQGILTAVMDMEPFYGSWEQREVLKDVADKIKEYPAAAVGRNRRGKWEHVAGMNSRCSECGNYFPVKEFEERPFDVNFCIWCGADMREEA